MLSDKEYVRHSLELNLFFLRLVKEHAIFAAASLPLKDLEVSKQAIALKSAGEKLLSKAISLSDGVISPEVINSGELVTDLTLQLEKSTQFLTGIPIDTTLTVTELELTSANQPTFDKALTDEVAVLNKEAIIATTAAIAFKKKLLKDVLDCKAFSFAYPLMIDHIIREAEFYVLILKKLEKRDTPDKIKEFIELELNWNRIMGEHAKFIRGYLDPSEELLFETADTFAEKFDKLIKKTSELINQPELLPLLTKESLENVTALRNFKKQGAQGIAACKIKSIIPPLLSDHITREANHYLRLLKVFEIMK